MHQGESQTLKARHGSPSPQAMRCPYPGLRGFEEADAAHFFGREQALDALWSGLQRLPAQAQVSEPVGLHVLLGASGSGKSSLLNAGLMPRLRQHLARSLVCGPFTVSPSLVQDLVNQLLATWPGPPPEPAALHAALAALQSAWPDSAPLADLLHQHGQARHAAPARASAGPPIAARLVWVFDQGERLWSADALPALRLVCALAAAHALPLVLVLALRSDHLDSLQSHLADLAAPLHLHMLRPMQPDELARAVTAPAAAMGRVIEPELTEALVADARGQALNLPLLACTLRQLWLRTPSPQRLVLADYHELPGGLAGSVTELADSMVASLGAEQAALLPGLWPWLCRLVGPPQRPAAVWPVPGAFGLADQMRDDFSSTPVETASLPPAGQPASWQPLSAPMRLLALALEAAGLLKQTPTHWALAHACLWQYWPALHAAWQREQAFEQWQRASAPLLRAWQQSGRDVRAVNLSGAVLEQALAWQASHGAAMPEALASLVRASAMLARGLARQRQVTRVTHLAAQARLLMTSAPPDQGELGLLLALEAFNLATALPEAWLATDQAVRQGLALLPRRPRLLEAGDDVCAAAWSVHPRQPLVVWGQAGQLRVWHLQRDHSALLCEVPGVPEILRFSADGLCMAAAGDGWVLLWQMPDHQLHTLPAVLPAMPDQPLGPANAMVFSRCGQWLAVGLGRQVLVWSTSHPGLPPQVLPEAAGNVLDLDFSADAQVLVVQDGTQPARCWQWQEGQHLGQVGRAGHQVLHSADGQLVATAGPARGAACIWDTVHKKTLALAPDALRLAFSPDGQWLALATSGPAIQLSCLPEHVVVHRWPHEAPAWQVAFSPDSTRLLSAAADGVVQLHGTQGGELQARLIHHEPLLGARFAGDSRTVISLSGKGRFMAWFTSELGQLRSLSFGDAAAEVAFSTDGRLLAVGVQAGDDKLRPVLVNLEDLSSVGMVEATGDQAAIPGPQYAGALLQAGMAAHQAGQRSPTGQWRVSQGLPGVLTLLASPLPSGMPSAMPGAAPDPEQDGAEGLTLAHTHALRQWMFSPDEQYLATVSVAHEVVVWDLLHGLPMSQLRLDMPTVLALAFSPDGRMLATAGRDGLVRLWLWRREDLQQEARRRIGRSLSAQERRQHLGG